MKICLIFPPVFDPSMPYLAPYQLQSYLTKIMPGFIVDVVDLNILFFNNIIKNPYVSFDCESDVTSSYLEIIKNEKIIKDALLNWSKDKGIKITRQSIIYNFNQDLSVNVLDFIGNRNKFNESIESLLINNVQIDKYDIIGFSIAVYDQLIPSLLMAKKIKNLYQDKITVIGGNVVSRIWKNLLSTNLTKHIDYIVRKEGELPLINLIKHLSGGQIYKPSNNLIYANTGDIIDIDDNPIIVDIDTLPITEFKGVDLRLYYSPILVLPLSFSRGCNWGKCTFCGIHSGWCSLYRTRSIDKMVGEIDHHMSIFNINSFRLVDESPSLRDILSLSNEIIRRGMDIRLEAYSNLYKQLINESNAKTLYNAGFRQLFLGIESLDRYILKEVKKEINDPSHYYLILNNLHKHGISNYGFFIIGFPNDIIDNERKLEKFINSSECLSTIALSSFIPISNSEMYNDIEYKKKYDIEFMHRGDITTRCDYKIKGKSVGYLVNKRAGEMVKRIFEQRNDLFVSSNIPYEARFYLCIKYGNEFNKNIIKDPRFKTISLQLSDELNQRVMGLAEGYPKKRIDN